MHPEAGLNEDCDSTNVTFTKHIEPILIQYCGTTDNSCHSSTNTNSNPSLGSYADDSLLVSLDNGQLLLSSLTHDGTATPMPISGGKLSECKINKFRAWINQGLKQ